MAGPAPIASAGSALVAMLAWVSGLVGFAYLLLALAAFFRRGTIFAHDDTISSAFILLSLGLASWQWYYLLRGRFGLALTCFALAISALVAAGMWNEPACDISPCHLTVRVEPN